MPSNVHQANWLDQLPTGIDFRHRCNTLLADQIISRAVHLKGPDRALVEAMFRDGRTAAEIARLGNESPRHIRRRIKRALIRLNDPTFIFVITHSAKWSPTRRKIACSIFQAGLSIRQTAQDLDLKVHQVRRHRLAILELMRTKQTHAPNRSWKYPK